MPSLPFDMHPKDRELAVDLYRFGHTDKEVCKLLKVAERTFYRWLKKPEQSDFRMQVERAKIEANNRVKESLFRRATGYTVTETHKELVPGTDGKARMKTMRVVEKSIAPDTIACIFWLKNREPDKWRDRQEQEINTEAKITVVRRTERGRAGKEK